MMGVPRGEWGSQAQWAVTAPLLAATLCGVGSTLPAALALCAVSLVHYLGKLGTVRGYRVQVRLGFLTVAAIALVPGFEQILWVPLLGTTSQVLLGYCPMARILDLMPWNRRDSLSWAFVVAVVTRRPDGEGLLF